MIFICKTNHDKFKRINKNIIEGGVRGEPRGYTERIFSNYFIIYLCIWDGY